MPSSRQLADTADQVVIAVDPHKASWTAVAVDARLQPLGAVRAPVSKAGYRQLQRFAQAWPQARWAIEGARGLGAPLTARLAEDGITVLDVPAKLARRVRLLSTGHGRKTDEADALSVGIAAQTATGLHVARLDESIAALRALIEHREDLVRTRTQTINRLHALLTKLVPAGLPRKLTADIAARTLRGVRPRADLGRTLRALAVDLVTEIRRLDRRITAVADQICAAVAESGTTLTELHGIGDLLAAKILARTAGVDRFRSAAAFASYCGVAPLDASSGDVKRHRLSRGGDRQLNCALHIMAITQIRRQTAGRDFYQRKRAEGKSHKEALRCLKRRLCDVVYRTMIKDTDTSLLAAA
ncbi:IS110 family transposase [Actinomadura sp. NAK00032]|uniref:IS110 family transposase n=1 Tax=Actinomadura TaxID=1988 RepID=UPI00158FF3EE|nr:IS110 family transposase [Actinomadura sp. NAK00032]QKW36281.1 IS110 family transposase [Actinomadura sp. NAK00032]